MSAQKDTPARVATAAGADEQAKAQYLEPSTAAAGVPANLKAARKYADLGLHPIRLYGVTFAAADGHARCSCAKGDTCPPRNRGKHPNMGPAWQTAPFDLNRLLPLLAAPGTHNLGLRMGVQPDGRALLALDVDDFDGFKSLCERIGMPPETLTTRSGREGGGYHLIYRVPPELLPRLTNFQARDGVDLRAGGAQVVAAPSTHYSGRAYELACDAAPADLPQAWIDWLCEQSPERSDARTGTARRTPTVEAQDPETINAESIQMLAKVWPPFVDGEQRRRKAHMALAGLLRQSGMSEEFALDYTQQLCLVTNPTHDPTRHDNTVVSTYARGDDGQVTGATALLGMLGFDAEHGDGWPFLDRWRELSGVPRAGGNANDNGVGPAPAEDINEGGEQTSALVSTTPARTKLTLSSTALHSLAKSRRGKAAQTGNELLRQLADGSKLDAAAIEILVPVLCAGFPEVADESLAEAFTLSLRDGTSPADVLPLVTAHRATLAKAARAAATGTQIVGLLGDIQKTALAGRNVRYNLLSNEIEVDGLRLNDLVRAQLVKRCEELGVTKPDQPVSDRSLNTALRLAAHEDEYHPVCEYLQALPKWDGEDRNLSTYLGAEQTPYNREICACQLRAAVARVLELGTGPAPDGPGCKADAMVVLEGPQGLMKSTAVEALCPEDTWFYAASGSLKDKDFVQDMRGKWLCEISEVDRLVCSKDDSELKDMLSKKVDRYRKSYGVDSQDYPRQVVFFGTTNKGEYLRDETGNRRYWSLKCGSINVGGIRRDRDQIWAQALAERQAGQQWWLTKELEVAARAAQAERLETDVWEDLVRQWLTDRTETEPFTTVNALAGLPGATPGAELNPGHKKRMGNVLRALGYELGQPGGRSDRTRRWSLTAEAAAAKAADEAAAKAAAE